MAGPMEATYWIALKMNPRIQKATFFLVTSPSPSWKEGGLISQSKLPPSSQERMGEVIQKRGAPEKQGEAQKMPVSR